MNRWAVKLLCAGTIGCGQERAFAREYAEGICGRFQSCAPGMMDRTFGEPQVCRDTVRDRMGQLRRDRQCNFQPQEAAQCLKEVEHWSCGQLMSDVPYGACNEVYYCESDNDTGDPSFDTGW